MSKKDIFFISTFAFLIGAGVGFYLRGIFGVF